MMERPAETPSSPRHKQPRVHEATPHEIQLAKNGFRNIGLILVQHMDRLVYAIDHPDKEAPDMAMLAPLHNRAYECLTMVFDRLLADAIVREAALQRNEDEPASVKEHAKLDNRLAFGLMAQLNVVSVIQAVHLQVLRRRDTLLPESATYSPPEIELDMIETLRVTQAYCKQIVVTSTDPARFVPRQLLRFPC